jgi:hypothetical protein
MMDLRLAALFQGSPWAIGPQDMGRVPPLGVAGALRTGTPLPALDSRLQAQQVPQFAPPWVPGQPGPSPIAQAQQEWAQRLRQQYPDPRRQGWGSLLGSALLPALVGKLAGGSGREALLYGVGSAAQHFTDQLNQYRDVEARIAEAEASLPLQEAQYGAPGSVKVNSVIKTPEGYKAVMSDGAVVPTGEKIYTPPPKEQLPNYESNTIEDPDNPGSYVVAMVNKRDPSDVRIVGNARPTATDVKMASSAADQLAMLPTMLRVAEQNVQGVINKIDQALNDVAWYNTGVIFGGETAQRWLQSSADLAATIRSIAANTAFDRLQEIRDAAKTGGGLGPVSERELDLLRDAREAIAQSQSEEQLRQNLINLKIRYQSALTALQNETKFKEWALRRQASGTPPSQRLPLEGVDAPGAPRIPPQTAPQAGPQWSIVDPMIPGAPAERAKRYLERVQ